MVKSFLRTLALLGLSINLNLFGAGGVRVWFIDENTVFELRDRIKNVAYKFDFSKYPNPEAARDKFVEIFELKGGLDTPAKYHETEHGEPVIIIRCPCRIGCFSIEIPDRPRIDFLSTDITCGSETKPVMDKFKTFGDGFFSIGRGSHPTNLDGTLSFAFNKARSATGGYARRAAPAPSGRREARDFGAAAPAAAAASGVGAAGTSGAEARPGEWRPYIPPPAGPRITDAMVRLPGGDRIEIRRHGRVVGHQRAGIVLAGDYQEEPEIIRGGGYRPEPR